MSKLELKIIPPLVMLIFAIAMWGVAQISPAISGYETLANISSKIFLVTGFLILFIAAFYFFRAKTTINPMRPENASALVTTGLYSFSRNPIYLADILFLISWGLYLSNPISLVLIVGFVPYLNRFQIIPEERVLEAHFGEEYLAFKARVRRWI